MISLACAIAAVGAIDAHQAFVERHAGVLFASTTGSKASAMRRSLSAATISSVARKRFLAQRVALDVRMVGGERAVPLGARDGQRVLSAAENFRHGAGVTRRGHAADGHGHRGGAGGGHDRLVAHAGQQAVGGDRQFVGRATRQHDAELVAGEAAEIILAAQARAKALGDLRDHFLGDVEAIGLVEAAEMIDGHQQEAARTAEANASRPASMSVRPSRTRG